MSHSSCTSIELCIRQLYRHRLGSVFTVTRRAVRLSYAQGGRRPRSTAISGAIYAGVPAETVQTWDDFNKVGLLVKLQPCPASVEMGVRVECDKVQLVMFGVGGERERRAWTVPLPRTHSVPRTTFPFWSLFCCFHSLHLLLRSFSFS